MDRAEFEALRDLPGKMINGDIQFVAKKATLPVLVVEDLGIDNAQGVDLRMNLTYNPETSSLNINVHVRGIGPICRLDVNHTMHRPAGRTHKHTLQTDQCPDRNLPDNVADCGQLAGKPVEELFEIFCKLSHITHNGNFVPPAGAGKAGQP